MLCLQGEIQLATTVFIAGSCVMQFPMKQCERIIQAYIGMSLHCSIFYTVDTDTMQTNSIVIAFPRKHPTSASIPPSHPSKLTPPTKV